jgi:hypothetical protein
MTPKSYKQHDFQENMKPVSELRSWLERIPAVEWKETRSPLEIDPQRTGTAIRSPLAKLRSPLETNPQPAGNYHHVRLLESEGYVVLKNLTCFTVMGS